eukprot:scaffold588_cov34-Attheya_sp.AAC.1
MTQKALVCTPDMQFDRATPPKPPQQLANTRTHNGHSAGSDDSDDSQCYPSLPAALPTADTRKRKVDTPTRPTSPCNPPHNECLTAAVGSSTFVPPRRTHPGKSMDPEDGGWKVGSSCIMELSWRTSVGMLFLQRYRGTQKLDA